LEPTAKTMSFDANDGVRFWIISWTSSKEIDAKERLLEALWLAFRQSIDKEHKKLSLLVREPKSLALANRQECRVDRISHRSRDFSSLSDQ
jgi:hypothetical protein